MSKNKDKTKNNYKIKDFNVENINKPIINDQGMKFIKHYRVSKSPKQIKIMSIISEITTIWKM